MEANEEYFIHRSPFISQAARVALTVQQRRADVALGTSITQGAWSQLRTRFILFVEGEVVPSIPAHGKY